MVFIAVKGITSMEDATGWASWERQARAITSDAYWKRRALRTLNDTCLVLEKYFHVYVTMSDRMFINSYVREFMAGWKELPFKQRLGASVDIPAEIAGKFLMIHYNFRDVDAMRNAIFRRGPNMGINKGLREYRHSIENRD